MSMNRMALRCAAVLALTNYYEEPWPTLAKGRVFDSRIDPVQGALKKDDLIPSIAVYTDADSGMPLSENNGGPPFRREVDLTLWLSIGQLGEDSTAENQILELPDTDARLEAALDQFEFQARFALSNYQNKWGRLFLQQWSRMTGWRSDRLVTEGNVRLAARQMTATMEIRDDDLPEITTDPNAEPELPENIEAILKAVQASGEPRGDVAGIIEMMRSSNIPSLITADKLQTIWMGATHPSVEEGKITPSPVATAENLYGDE